MQKTLKIAGLLSAITLIFGIGTNVYSDTNHPHTTEARVDIIMSSAGHSFQIGSGQTSAIFQSPELSPSLSAPFDVAGLEWEGNLPEHTSITFFLQNPDGTWQLAPLVGDESRGPDQVNKYMTQAVGLQATHTKFKVVLERDSVDVASPLVQSVQLIAVNGGQTSALGRAMSAVKRLHAGSSLHIISREEWGADESYRFTSDNQELWTPTYVTPEKFIVHHTAGGTGGDDPAATVRAIYYWHAQVLGWGDIGYNYLIDEEGDIFQGRYGDDGVVGAHAYNDVRNINYNEGSVGIALLGCYEADDDGACSTISEPSDALFSSLARLIGTKGKALGIKPKHTATLFHDIEIPNVVGHRDVDYTLCPGSILHDDLVQIREQAQTVFESIQPTYQATFTSSDNPRSVDGDTDFDLIVHWKNTGKHTWKQTTTFLKVYNISGHSTTPLKKSNWKDPFGKILPQEDMIAPEETATFSIPLHTLLENKSRSLKIKVFHRTVSMTKATPTITIHTIESFAVSPLLIQMPLAVLPSWRPTVTVTTTNLGTQTLPIGTPLLLNNEIVASTEVAAPPGAEVSWVFTWIPPQSVGIQTLSWKIIQNELLVPGSKIKTQVRIDN